MENQLIWSIKEKLKQRIVIREEVEKKLNRKLPERDCELFLKPYESKVRQVEIKKISILLYEREKDMKIKPEDQMLELILNFAKYDDRIRVILMNGSRANPRIEKDTFRDY